MATLPAFMEYYTLKPGLLVIIQDTKPTAVLDPIEVVLSKMPSRYMLLKPVQVEVQAGQDNGSVTMRYYPHNGKMDTIEVIGNSVDEAELLMRSAFGEAWRRYLIMSDSSPYIVNGNVAAIGQELSDFVK